MTPPTLPTGPPKPAAVYCVIHPHVTLRCPACNGTKGGQKTSAAKTKAARKNAKLGGRPPKKILPTRQIS